MGMGTRVRACSQTRDAKSSAVERIQDTLFQPQQHPARDAHDTFFIQSPSRAQEKSCNMVVAVVQHVSHVPFDFVHGIAWPDPAHVPHATSAHRERALHVTEAQVCPQVCTAVSRVEVQIARLSSLPTKPACESSKDSPRLDLTSHRARRSGQVRPLSRSG